MATLIELKNPAFLPEDGFELLDKYEKEMLQYIQSSMLNNPRTGLILLIDEYNSIRFNLKFIKFIAERFNGDISELIYIIAKIQGSLSQLLIMLFEFSPNEAVKFKEEFKLYSPAIYEIIKDHKLQSKESEAEAKREQDRLMAEALKRVQFYIDGGEPVKDDAYKKACVDIYGTFDFKKKEAIRTRFNRMKSKN